MKKKQLQQNTASSAVLGENAREKGPKKVSEEYPASPKWNDR